MQIPRLQLQPDLVIAAKPSLRFLPSFHSSRLVIEKVLIISDCFVLHARSVCGQEGAFNRAFECFFLLLLKSDAMLPLLPVFPT